MSQNPELSHTDLRIQRIKMAQAVLNMRALDDELRKYDLPSLQKAASAGTGQPRRIKYAALVAQREIEKQAFLSALGRIGSRFLGSAGKALGMGGKKALGAGAAGAAATGLSGHGSKPAIPTTPAATGIGAGAAAAAAGAAGSAAGRAAGAGGPGSRNSHTNAPPAKPAASGLGPGARAVLAANGPGYSTGSVRPPASGYSTGSVRPNTPGYATGSARPAGGQSQKLTAMNRAGYAAGDLTAPPPPPMETAGAPPKTPPPPPAESGSFPGAAKGPYGYPLENMGSPTAPPLPTGAGALGALSAR